MGLKIPETQARLAQGLNLDQDPVEHPPASDNAGLMHQSREPASICNAMGDSLEAGHRSIPYLQRCCGKLRMTAYSGAAQPEPASGSTDRTAAVAIEALPLICQVCNEQIEPTQNTRRCRYVATSVGRHCQSTVHQCCFRASHDQCINCRLQDADEEDELEEFSETNDVQIVASVPTV